MPTRRCYRKRTFDGLLALDLGKINLISSFLLKKFFNINLHRFQQQLTGKKCRRLSQRPCSFYRPLAAQCTLLAKPCFICRQASPSGLKPYFYCFSRIISTDLPDLITDFFLKASLSSGLPFGCSGRLET
jgi:hypothetical protein